MILLLSLALAFIGFTFLNGMSINMVLVILGVVVLIASFIPMIVILGSKETKKESDRQLRYVARPSQSLQQTWENHSQNKHKYCIDCGSLVDFSDFYCATCGSRLK
jgi:hypothetical protein